MRLGEMAGERFLLLHINRSCVKLGFHDAEGFLDPPEIVIGSINLRSLHLGFRSYDHVIPR